MVGYKSDNRNAHIDIDSTVRSGAVIYSCGKYRRYLPCSIIKEIRQSEPPSLIPHTHATFDGLVNVDGYIVSQLNLSENLKDHSGHGQYSIYLKTKIAPILLRVNSVSFVDYVPDGSDIISGLPEIESLMSGLTPTESPGIAPSSPESTEHEDRFHTLIVKSAGKLVALPAEAIEQVERHQGYVDHRLTHTRGSVVKLASDILSGWSLAEYLDPFNENKGNGEAWAIIFCTAGRRAVLTVDSIEGLFSVPIRNLSRLMLNDTPTFWLKSPSHGLIELLDIAMLGDQGHNSVLDGLIPNAVAPLEVDSQPIGSSGLSMDFGAFSCVFPETMIAEVIQNISPRRTHHRMASTSLPLLDPAIILGLPAISNTTQMAVTVTRPGRRTIALLAPSLRTATTTSIWLPLPTLPRVLRTLFQAVRINGKSCEFLVRGGVFDLSHDPAILRLVKPALTGWLSST